MSDEPSHPLDLSSIGSRVRSRKNNESEPLRSVDSSTPSLDLMVEVESPKSVDVTEAESSPLIPEMEGSLQIGSVLVIGVKVVEGWREKYSIPNHVAIRIPGPFNRASDFEADKIAVYKPSTKPT
ncbi:hypothetical protein F2Q70_00003603 [Brassica cretica]|uniref:Uncharacterized protein n=1 Tax=Brassica cretica TaxID=69181 RepID=A0A8S9IRV8_BRACR|nr:hypothetical protein F2Q70_00003603 [Brassica cretica]